MELFIDDEDRARFLFLLLHHQSTLSFKNTRRHITSYNPPRFWIHKEDSEILLTERTVSAVAFCIMPNHFHILLENKIEGGISLYMHKVLVAYSKYFAIKYKHSGHVFQGPFVSVPIKTNAQLLHVSAYIHKNPAEIGWGGKEHLYPWSSYQDYVGTNRWGDLLERNIILEQFDDALGYNLFVSTSLAKSGQ